MLYDTADYKHATEVLNILRQHGFPVDDLLDPELYTNPSPYITRGSRLNVMKAAAHLGITPNKLDALLRNMNDTLLDYYVE